MVEAVHYTNARFGSGELMIFGNVPISATDILNKLAIDVPRTAERIGAARPDLTSDGHRVWTLAVKNVLSQLVKEHKGQPICTEADEHQSEFMLDFVWWERIGNPPSSRAVLGCESEWGNSRYPAQTPNLVADDFEKLLSFKAPLKLLIFGTRSSEVRAQVHETIRTYGLSFQQHVKGECYLFAEFADRKCYRYSFTVPNDGVVEDFTLVHLTEESRLVLQK